MSTRQMIINLLHTLPEDAPLEQIAREVELLAGIQVARSEARRGEGIDANEARALVDEWAAP